MPQRANFEEGIMTGTQRLALAVAHASMDRFRQIVKREKALVIFHHDMVAWREIKKKKEGSRIL